VAGSPPIALTGATVVVSLDPPEVASCDVVLAGGRVVALGAPPPGSVRRDCSGTLVMPGNVCAHHHLYSALARGMPYRLAPPGSFLEILQGVWWRLDRALDPESLRCSALVGGLEALAAGTTTVVDHHSSPRFVDGSLDVIADALEELGLRSVLCYEVSERDGPSTAALEENRRFLARTCAPSGRPPLLRGMVGAHASFTLSEETLLALAEMAAGFGTGVHIHVAEDELDERDCLERFGRRVVERLSAAGVLTDKALLAHCVHVDGGEVRLVEAASATVACNPRSNMNNGVGRSPFERLGGRVALGTDGIGGDMLAESQVGLFRARELDLGTPGSWALSRLAESARVAGDAFGEPLLGTLRPGAPADAVVLAYDPPTPFEPEGLAGHLAFGLTGAAVRDVFVGGEPVVEGGRSTRVDGREVAAAAARAAKALWEAVEQLPPHRFDPGSAWRGKDER
jgi:putative selenium metabolism protein SsnA